VCILLHVGTQGFTAMRTNIEIDDALMAEAMRLTGQRTKKATVEEALRRVVRLEKQKGILELRGMGWEGDLRAWRRDDDGADEEPAR
jgi:Arc/MetJ family transcription regulator